MTFMIQVNSLSGGKTSSYMAVHYPADYNVFSVVTIDDKKSTPAPWLQKKVSEKLGFDFIATAEDDKTLIVILELEQKLGKEIIWLSGISFDQLISKRKAVPNKMWRFCTTEMKIRPIWDWWYKNFYPEIIQMNIGFRYDEKERAKPKEVQQFKGIIGNENGRNKWIECDFKIDSYPLIDNHIGHYTVKKWADSSGLIFPQDSNCVGCFWKPLQQLRKNFDENTNKMQWFSDRENIGRWKTEVTYEEIKRIGIQSDFFFGTGSGCQAGYCTD